MSPRAPDRPTATLSVALAAALLALPLAGCLGFGSAGTLPAGSIQVSNDAPGEREVTVTVRKAANDSDGIDRDAARPDDPIWTREWTLEVPADGTATRRSAIDEPGAFHVTAVVEDPAVEADGPAGGAVVGNDTAWLGLYSAGREGDQVAEATVWISVDDHGTTISTPVDD